MFDYFFLTLVFFGIFLIFMSIGVILSDLQIKGSCGGASKLTGQKCPHCSGTGSASTCSSSV